MAISPPGSPGTGTLPDTFMARSIREIIEVVTSGEDVGHKLSQWWIDHKVAVEGYLLDAGFGAVEDLISILNGVVVGLTPAAAALSAETINQITGTNINPASVDALFKAPPSRDTLLGIGESFHDVIEKMFPLAESVSNSKDRADRDFAVNNLNAYFGTNLSMNLRSLAIGTVASLVPKFHLQHLEELHQTISWAYGFGWLSWTVMAAVMNATTTKPLTEYYNAKIKGNDFTETQALHAFTQKRLQQDELNKILDNHGIRDDIRQTLIDQTYRELSEEQATRLFIEGYITQSEFTRIMDAHGTRDQDRQARIDGARPKLSDGKLAQGYENGLFSEQFVKDELKSHGYDEVRGQAELDLIKDNRLFALRKRLEETFFHGYVIGTVTQPEFTNYLASIGYSQLEVDMELKRAEIIARSHLQKHLTRAEIIRLVADGGMAASEGLARLVAQGLPDADARRLLADSVLRYAVSLVPPKVRDACLTGHVEQNLLTAAIQSVTQLDPTYVVTNKAFFNQAQCILEQYTSGAASTTAPAPAQAPAAPTALTGGVGPTGIDLHWQPIQGLADYQLYRRQIGDAAYLPIGPSSTKTTFTDTTTTKGEIYLYVVRAKVNGVESPNSNEVQVQP